MMSTSVHSNLHSCGSGEDGDLVECDRCGIAVHEGTFYSFTVCCYLYKFMCVGCYGVPEDEDTTRDDCSDLSSFTTVPWFCDACKAGINSFHCVSHFTLFDLM